jgi:hypothetical protein
MTKADSGQARYWLTTKAESGQARYWLMAKAWT